MTPALQKALQVVMQEIQKAEGAALRGGGGMKVEIEAEGGEGPEMQKCPACAEGTCTDPDHMDDSEVEEMAGSY
jgi:hypothetical protein